MSMKVLLRASLLFSCAGMAITAAAAEEPAAARQAEASLEDQFRDPPATARPRVWWHWMNGNITREGIAKDLAWMKRVGIGGLQNFDANLMTPQIVDTRLVYMTPEWKDAFRFAAAEADRHGLEMAIAASPGWSETGGPWVKPEDGLKKLVWSETEIAGGRRFSGRLAPPPEITGPFQSQPMQESIGAAISGEKDAHGAHRHYADVAVIAVPLARSRTMPMPKIVSGEGKAIDGGALFDADLASAVEIARPASGSPSLVLTYAQPQTVRAASLHLPGSAMMFFGSMFAPVLEASTDGTTWRKLADMPATAVPTTISFPPVTARHFRIVLGARSMNMASMGAMAEGADPGPYARMGGMQPPIRIGDLRLYAEPRVDRFESKAGFAIERDYYALSQGLPDAGGIAPGDVVDLTARMKPDGTLDWTPPAGRWKVLRLGYSLLGTTNHPAPPEATGLEVDKFDGPAVRRYLEHYIGMYRDASGGLIGKQGVNAILTDSIEVGAANWTPRMIAQFKRLRGYDPTPWLPALTGTIIGSSVQSDKFLYDYRRTLADLMASEHYGTVAKVAHEAGLKVYGEALEDKRPSLGDDMAMRRHADIPMAAFWTFKRGTDLRHTLIADMKGAASVANVYGQNLVAAESLTSAMNPWNYAPNDLKRMIDIEFVTGVNRPVIHTSVHQPVDDKVPGLSLFIFGQYFNRHETWAELARPWVDYMARNSLMLQQGRNFADVAYFYGEEAPLTSLYGDGLVADAPKSRAYDFINADALSDALRNEGEELVSTGGARYRAVYLGGSSHKMTLATLRTLARLAEGGATIVGIRPEASPSLSGADAAGIAEYAALLARLWPGTPVAQVGKGRVVASKDIDAALDSIGVGPDFRFAGASAGADIPFLHRRLADGDSYFLVNRRDQTETFEAHFRVTGKVPELWHADTGTSEPVSYRIEGGETILPLTLAAEQSLHVVFRKPAIADAFAIKKVVPTQAARLDGAWSVAFQPGRGAPASTVMANLAPLDESSEAGIKYFSGIASYGREFNTPKGWRRGQPLWLDLGEVRELAEVSVNGKVAGSAWHAPYRLEIGAFAKPGRNLLEVRVANLWVNRLIGDAQPGAQKITWTALPTYRADAPLRRSGLIGPVTLMTAHGAGDR
jgi:hypothetical protein